MDSWPHLSHVMWDFNWPMQWSMTTDLFLNPNRRQLSFANS